jgi:hypothetical protein
MIKKYFENNIPYFNPEEEAEVFDEFENLDYQDNENIEENKIEQNYYPRRYDDFLKRKVVHLNYFYSIG